VPILHTNGINTKGAQLRKYLMENVYSWSVVFVIHRLLHNVGNVIQYSPL